MKLKIIFLFIILFLTMVLSLHAGPVVITWIDLWKFLTFQGMGDSHTILSQLRLPRIISAGLIGAALGSVGVVFQTLLRNPLAEPYTLGLSGGSALGAVLALNLALSPAIFWIPLLSSIGCLGSAGLVLILAHRQMEFESRSLILFGVMISLFFGAMVVTGLSILSPERLQAALFWLLGEFGTTRDQWIISLGPFLLFGILILIWRSDALDALSLGEARAMSLGFSPKKERTFFILICTLLTAFGVSIAGLIGFIGLVSPHVSRKLLKSSQHQIQLIGASLVGAILLIFADAIGRIAAGNIEIPAGSVAALFGAPVLIFLLMSQKNAQAE
jgi:ABC-type Fe3+-siderophore transport system permease subunit